MSKTTKIRGKKKFFNEYCILVKKKNSSNKLKKKVISKPKMLQNLFFLIIKKTAKSLPGEQKVNKKMQKIYNQSVNGQNLS